MCVWMWLRTQTSLPTQLCFMQGALRVLRGKTNFGSPKPSGLGRFLAGLSVPFPFSHCWAEREFGSGRSTAGTRGREQLRGQARRGGRPRLLSDVALLWDKD